MGIHGILSHRSRGAWIEIGAGAVGCPTTDRRIAHAVRGLKYPLLATARSLRLSHRSRGAWIEMDKVGLFAVVKIVASLTRCVD